MGTRFVKPRFSRLYLRIPKVDWPNVTQGRKRELRSHGGPGALLAHNLHPPVPVVGYVVGVVGPRFKLLVIEEAWSEPLGAIGAESLAAEGFDTRAEFRSYWRHRYRRPFKPLETVQVYRLRPYTPADRAELAERMFDHLYGEYDRA